MRRVNIPEFRKEVVAIIEENRDKVTTFEAQDDYSIFTFCGQDYACEVQISAEWFGYDLGISNPYSQLEYELGDNDDGRQNEEVQLIIYDEILETVRAIFDGKIKYLFTSNYSYIVTEGIDGTYRVRHLEKKKFLWLTYTSGWYNGEMSKDEYDKLGLDSLKVLS